MSITAPAARRLTLNQALMLAAFIALLPIAALSIIQGMAVSSFAQDLIAQRLVAGALSTAAVQRDEIGGVRRQLAGYAADPVVREAMPACGETLKRGLSTQRAAVDFMRISADRTIQCGGLPFAPGQRYTPERWWSQGVESRELTFSQPMIGRVSKRAVIVAMHPLTQPDGSFDGAVTAAIDVSWLEAGLRSSKLSSDSMAAIVDRSGSVLISSRSDAPRRFDLSRIADGAATLELADGTTWLAASAALYARDLFVVYAELEQPLLSPLREQTRTAIFLPILALLLTCIAIYAAANRFVLRWLRTLGRLAQRYSRGDYSRDDNVFSEAPREIATLGADLGGMAQAIEARDLALQQSAIENRAMAREVNHRVKNNLQMVISLLGLQSARVSDAEARSALEQTRIRMGAVALIHRLLYDQGEKSDRGVVDMKRLTTDLCMQLRASMRKPSIVLGCECEMGEVLVDRAIPMTLFAVEAVTNAYRHAFPANVPSQVVLCAMGTGDCGTVSVSDNGVGGFEKGQPNALGFELMEAYASQLGGTMLVEDAPGTGVKMSIVFPASPEPVPGQLEEALVAV